MNLMSSEILPCFFRDRYMASTPEIVAAAFSKALWIQGIFQAVYSDMHVETSRHPVALDAMRGYSEANSTILTTVGAPQPAHIRCPPVISTSFLESSFKISGVAMSIPSLLCILLVSLHGLP